MIMPVGKSFVVLSPSSGAINGGASQMPLLAKIIVSIILFLLLIATGTLAFGCLKSLLQYYRNIEADDIMLACLTMALFIANLAGCIAIWFA